MFSAVISDCSGSCFVTIAGDLAEKVVGMPPSEFKELSSEDAEAHLKNNCRFKQQTLIIKGKSQVKDIVEHTYADENKSLIACMLG
jgi:hypothetical protein